MNHGTTAVYYTVYNIVYGVILYAPYHMKYWKCNCQIYTSVRVKIVIL